MSDSKDPKRHAVRGLPNSAPTDGSFVADNAPTIRLDEEASPQPRPAVTLSLPAQTRGTVSPIRDSLHNAEAARASTIGLVYSIIGITTLSWVPFLGGHSGFQWAFAVVIAIFCVSSLAIWHIASVPERYGHRLFRLYGMWSVITSFAAMVYLGPFSPTALVITLGIGFFGQGGDRLGAWMICGMAIALTLLLMTGIVTGLIEDVGVFRGTETGIRGMSFILLNDLMRLIMKG